MPIDYEHQAQSFHWKPKQYNHFIGIDVLPQYFDIFMIYSRGIITWSEEPKTFIMHILWL